LNEFQDILAQNGSISDQNLALTVLCDPQIAQDLVKVWVSRTGRLLRTLRGHVNEVGFLAAVEQTWHV